MMNDLAKSALVIAKEIKKDASNLMKPPSEGAVSTNDSVLPFSLVKGTRGYIERIVHQINGCYSSGWYDGSAVMIRRLVETLIIETFEQHHIAAKIKNPSGDFYYLRDLITHTLNETAWNLTRNAKQALPRLKDIGDQSAHSRRFIAHREDIDKVMPDLRVVAQELIFLAKLK